MSSERLRERLFVDLFFGGVPVGKLHAAERHALLKRRDAGVFREDGVADPRGLPDQKAPRRAHEYLHKAALELCDGLVIQRLVGSKKVGDFNPAAILRGHEALIRGVDSLAG